MSYDIDVKFQTVIVEVGEGFSAGILFNGDLIQERVVCKTRKQAKRRLKKFSAKFIKNAEHSARELGYTIDSIHNGRG